MSNLFSPLTIRNITLKNRIGVSPMCQYSSINGLATDWHLVHLGSRAIGGAAMVMVEATAVTADGRISPEDMGIWTDEHIAPLERITRFVKEHGSVPAIQLAHAGRKASTPSAWKAPLMKNPLMVSEAEGGWQVIAPSAIAFTPDYPFPREMTLADIRQVTEAFVQAARRSLQAGFEIVEIHAAHGYLLHEFLSPLSNQRTDEYGGSFENRTRILREVVTAVRTVWPESLPMFLRISATDWAEGGWDIEESVKLTAMLTPLGVDLVDCSSGALVADAKIPVGPGYQVPFAERIRQETGVLTAAVGMITEARQAEAIIEKGQADMVLLARELLRDPYWPLHAATELGVDVTWPDQYSRAAKPRIHSTSKG